MNVYRILHYLFSNNSLRNFLLQFLFIKSSTIRCNCDVFQWDKKFEKMPLKAILDNLEGKK